MLVLVSAVLPLPKAVGQCLGSCQTAAFRSRNCCYICVELFFAVDLLQWAQSLILLSFQEKEILASFSLGFSFLGFALTAS